MDSRSPLSKLCTKRKTRVKCFTIIQQEPLASAGPRCDYTSSFFVSASISAPWTRFIFRWARAPTWCAARLARCCAMPCRRQCTHVSSNREVPRRRPQRSGRLAPSIRSSGGTPGRPDGGGRRQLLSGRARLRSAPAHPGALSCRAEPPGGEGTWTWTGARRAGTYGTTRRGRGRPSGLGNLRRPNRCQSRPGDVPVETVTVRFQTPPNSSRPAAWRNAPSFPSSSAGFAIVSARCARCMAAELWRSISRALASAPRGLSCGAAISPGSRSSARAAAPAKSTQSEVSRARRNTQGDLAEFLPWLRAARWVGVGRQTVWGKGDVRVL